MTQLQRATQAGFDVVSGAEVLQRGFALGKALWNAVWWPMFGYNDRLRRVRGDTWEQVQQRRVKSPYPGKIGLQKEMQDHWAYRDLSDRCASYTVREFDIACRAWFTSVKRWKENGAPEGSRPKPPGPVKHKRTLTFEVGRNAKSMGNWTYRLTVLGGHIAERHAVVRIRVRKGVKMKDIKLLRIRPDGIVSLIRRVEPAPAPGAGIAALDLGMINLGALIFENGDSILYSGRALLDVQRLAEKRAAKCKPSGWQPGKERLPRSQRAKRYHNRATNIVALALHNFTTHVIRECVRRQVGVLLVGDLTGIRDDKDFGDKTNQKIHRWAQGRIRAMLRWKGENYGIEVREISEAYTSQTCSTCGVVHKANRVKRGLYICRSCGTAINADVNGAINMLKKVSPEAKAFGVGANLPGPPSPSGNRRTDITVANHPVFVAKFDLRDWRVVMTRQVASEQWLQH